MKLSNRTRYGMRAMLDLAVNYEERLPLPAHEIAKRNRIPKNFLEQLLRLLRKDGLVKSIRGSRGGYILGKSPAEIRVSDIIRVLEGPIFLAECLDNTSCGEVRACPSRILWTKIRNSIEEVTETTTLEDLITMDPEQERKYESI